MAAVETGSMKHISRGERLAFAAYSLIFVAWNGWLLLRPGEATRPENAIELVLILTFCPWGPLPVVARSEAVATPATTPVDRPPRGHPPLPLWRVS